VIFASARTGSTSLADLLNKIKGVNLCFEPFNEDYPKWKTGNIDYLSKIKDKSSFNKVLNDLFDNFNALKVLDYQLPEKYYFKLLSRSDIKILFLRRKSVLDQIISDLVAHQVGEWRKTKDINVYDNLKPLDLKEMGEKLKYVKKLNEMYYDYLEKSRKNDFLPLWYEELYLENLAANRTRLKKICDFLNIIIPSDKAIRNHMTPSVSKINYENCYKMIPNYDDIIERFGS